MFDKDVYKVTKYTPSSL